MKYVYTALLCVVMSISVIHTVSAQELVQDKQETVRARVLTIDAQTDEIIPGTDTTHTVQTLSVKILEGSARDRVISLRNDFVELKKGETFFLSRIIPWDGSPEQYIVSEPNRLPQLGWILALFIILVIIFGGKQGVRGLISLVGSLAFILYALIPGIMHGYSPVWLSIGVSSIIIIIGSYITHGFNKTTSSAVVGMICTIIIVGVFAHIAIGYTRLSGFSGDEATYLNFNFRGSLDLAGILLGGVLIGLLGVMYDAAIGQAVSIEELHRIAPHIGRKTIYIRALRIGREHIGALVNTLAIAYVGASLPLLLLFSTGHEPALITLNREVFSTEIVRSLIGSIGLVLAVPITSAIAVYMIIKKKPAPSAEIIIDEEKKIEHAGHHHH